MKATIVDLRYHMKDVLRAIDRGETVTVLFRGKPKARLMPIAAAAGPAGEGVERTEDQPIFGLWRDRGDLGDPVSYVRRMRQPRLSPAQGGAELRRRAAKSK
jgi:antitoxin (DNA-binding transcriptional repressor) of toxin-antitoxin stability system